MFVHAHNDNRAASQWVDLDSKLSAQNDVPLLYWWSILFHISTTSRIVGVQVPLLSRWKILLALKISLYVLKRKHSTGQLTGGDQSQGTQYTELGETIVLLREQDQRPECSYLDLLLHIHKDKLVASFNPTHIHHHISPTNITMATATTTQLPTVALFGATAGIGLSTLKPLLAAGYRCNVLARTPSKLADLSAKYPDTLHLIKGDIRDVPAITSTLTFDGKVADIVVSSFGMVMSRKGLGFTSNDPHICEEGTKHILSSVATLESSSSGAEFPAGGPKIVVLSTTGISAEGRDIPYAMMPLYHWMLPIPHDDKKKMEEVVKSSGRRFVVVRPSLLLDGEARGLTKVRVSTEGGEKKEKTAIGYTIRRDDVGLWIAEECIKGGEEKWGKWEGRMVTLTY